MNARQARIFKAYGSMLAMAIVVGVVSGFLLKTGRWPPAATIGTFAVLLAIGFAAARPYWRSIDDAARDAHKTAWYWGGSFGAGLGLIAAMVFGGGPLSLMAQGAMLAFGLQVVVYAVVWAGWWLVRRRPATA